MKNRICLIMLSILITSCEKVIDLDYKSNQSAIIIEGNISNEPGPYFVKITKSISLQETGAYPTIDNAIVNIVDDAGNSETLIPQGNGIYTTSSLVGVEGRTYTLTVNAENKTYTAKSTMPLQVPFDSIQIEKDDFGGEIEYNLIPKYLDPVENGNNYRFVLNVNNKLVKQHLIQNDEVKNGFVNTFKLEINDNDLDLKAGDLISIEMQSIDKNVALFYSALVLMADNGPGGGATPANPPTNITGNDALGIFSAYTTQTKTAIIQ